MPLLFTQVQIAIEYFTEMIHNRSRNSQQCDDCLELQTFPAPEGDNRGNSKEIAYNNNGPHQKSFEGGEASIVHHYKKILLILSVNLTLLLFVGYNLLWQCIDGQLYNFYVFFKIYKFIYNSMDKEVISVEPEIVQFGVDNKQLIKVTNHTSSAIQNCFFCLYNTNKYQFIPDSFTLQPKQHKLVTVIIKIRNTNQTSTKQLAYLKSKNINKRITIIHSVENSYSQQKLKSPLSGIEQINTLTNRDYRQTQKTAYQRLIAQKQAYINKLQRKLEEQQYTKQKQLFPNHKSQSSKHFLQQIQSLNLKVQLLLRQKEQLIKENIDIQAKFKEYRILMEGDMRITQLNMQVSQSMHEIGSQAEEIKYLQMQCEQFLKKISQKQTRIRENEVIYVSKIDEIIRESEKKLQEMQERIKQQRRQSEQQRQNLTKVSVEKYDKQIKSLKQQLQKKEKQFKSHRAKLEEQKQKQNKKQVKMQQQKSKLEQQNKQLKNKMHELNKSYQQLKQQTIIYKNKLFDNDASTEKIGHYLELALQSCKNENEILKKSKIDAQQTLNEQIKSRKYYENKLQKLEQSMIQTANKIKEVEQQKSQLLSLKSSEQQQAHDKIMELKSENIDLLQKINMNKKKEIQNQQQLEDSLLRLKNYEEQVRKLKKQNGQLRDKLGEAEDKLENLLEQKQKMKQKIQKYRQQAKKSIKNISQNAKDQLKRIQKQKNKLEKKVQQLEQKTITAQISEQNQKDLKNLASIPRNKTRTYHQLGNEQTTNNLRNRHPLSLMQEKQKDKKLFGIKNQRKQLQDSQAKSMSTVDMDKIYGQLGQLREFKGYINNAIERLREQLGMEREREEQKMYGVNGNSIFSAINFFKQLEQKVENKRKSQQRLKESQKQIQFLKGRLAELQPLVRTIKEKSSRKQQSIQLLNNPEIDRNAIEYIRQQMKNQYKKLYDALKISEDKYEILRKKIYLQYRARIIQLFAKKDIDQLAFNRIEAVLERFVDGLGNTSHKEALLAKQVKLKNQARKQAAQLKQKLTAVSKQLELKQNKKMGNKENCIREKEQLRLFMIQNDNQYIDNIKNEAKMLTYQAQNARLIQQKSSYIEKISTIEQQLKNCESDLQSREGEIQRLKKQVIIITKENSQQILKQQEQLQSFKKKFSQMQKMEKHLSELTIKQKENNHLRQQVQEKRQLIRNLRQREKFLQNLLNQSKKNESLFRDKEKKQYADEMRVQENLNDIKVNNRELRNENNELKKKIDALSEDLNKKNATLKRLKSEGEQYRIKNVKNQQESVEKLRIEIKQLKQEIKKIKEESDKVKRKKQKEINQIQSQSDRYKSELSIRIRSLESIIRALTDTLRGVYSSLEIVARKKGRVIGQLSMSNFDNLIQNIAEINSVKVGQFFEELIENIKAQN